ncbi:MAG: tetratricopeptide repeat protein [Pseudomonadota bacterium]
MRIVIAGLFFASAFLSACAANAQLQVYITECNSPDLAPERVIRNCTLALKTEELGPKGEAQTLYTRGNAFLVMGKTRLALRDYDSANKRDSGIFQIWEARGRALFRLGRVPESRTSFEEALKLNPDDRQARVGRGAALVALGQPEAALEDLDAALAEEPDDPTALFHRAMAFISMDNRPQAVSALGEVIALSPRFARAYYLRGQLREGDRPEAALADYNKAIELSPEEGRNYFARGMLLERLGDPAQALVDFKRAYELGLRNEELNRRLVDGG